MTFRQGLFGFFAGLSTASSLAYIYLLQDYKEITQILNQHKPNETRLNQMAKRFDQLENNLKDELKELRKDMAQKQDLKELRKEFKIEMDELRLDQIEVKTNIWQLQNNKAA